MSMPSKKEYLLWKLQGFFRFLKEYLTSLHNVAANKPEGKIANKYWVEDREWDDK